MQVEIGKIYTGKVKGIANYGAFVDLDEGGTGMVHISEIANTYVEDINKHLVIGQEVKVKVIGINEQGKVSLSIKKAVDENAAPVDKKKPYPPKERKSKPIVWEPKKTVPQSEMSFEEMMATFKQSSEEKMSDLKRSTDRKNKTKRK